MDEKRLVEIEGRDGAVPARIAEAGYGVVYEDRRALLAEVRRLRAEARQTHLALAAIVQRAGGEVTISMRDVVAVDPRAQLVVYEDPGLLSPALHVCLEPPQS